MVGELLAQYLLAPGVYLDLGIRLRPLRTKTQPHPDVVGQVDLLACGARDELGALAGIDLEGDGHPAMTAALRELPDEAAATTRPAAAPTRQMGGDVRRSRGAPGR